MDTRCAVLAVSFGTRFPDAWQTGIAPIERELADALPGFALRRASTGEILRRIPGGMNVPDVQQALDQLRMEGYRYVLIQPLFLTPGEEFDQLKAQAAPFSADGFSLAVGAPLLDTPEDCTALSGPAEFSGAARPDEALVLMGHGSLHHSNGEFLRMEQALRTEGRPDAFVGVMRGEPGLDRVLAAVHRRPHVRAVQLHPLLITAGMHARRDLAGSGDASWRTRLGSGGLSCALHPAGTGRISRRAPLVRTPCPGRRSPGPFSLRRVRRRGHQSSGRRRGTVIFSQPGGTAVMKICMTGLDDVQAPIELREQLSFTKSAAAELDRRMVELGCRGAVVLSTCNRTEVYLSLGEGQDLDPRVLLCQAAGISSGAFDHAFTTRWESTVPAI